MHCDPADRDVLRERGVYAALCARSNKILQSGQPPVADYLRENSPFGIGTDSLASTPSLDLLEEAAALRALALSQGYDADDLDRRIFEAATLGGAGACRPGRVPARSSRENVGASSGSEPMWARSGARWFSGKGRTSAAAKSGNVAESRT